MSLNEIAILGIAIFLVLMFLRMPVGIAMAIAGFVGVFTHLVADGTAHAAAGDWHRLVAHNRSSFVCLGCD